MSLEELKNRIKEEYPISQIIRSYLHLDKKGATFVGLCPFHNDSHPSMTVNDKLGIFKCFACQTGGDAINFVQLYRRIEFVDAVKEISHNIGLNFEDYVKPKNVSPEIEMAKKILSRAAKIYLKASDDRACTHYWSFLDERKIGDITRENFQIGFAPKNNVITNYLMSVKEAKDREFAIKIACEIQLIRPSKPGSSTPYYDVFRERIMFPIWDQHGVLCGFSGRRSLEEDKKTENKIAKYYNSSESFIFNKRNILFGLNQAKNAIREKDFVIIVEGHLDLIVLHQHGITNSVALMGTAMRDNLVETLKGLTKNFILGLDSDNPGMIAMKQIGKMLLHHGIMPKYLSFMPHKDADELLRNLGTIELLKRIDDAPKFIDKEIEDLIPAQIPEIFDRKLELLHKVFEILAPLKDSLEATERITRFAKALQLTSGPEQIISAYREYFATTIQSTAEQKPKATEQVMKKVAITEQTQRQISLPSQEIDLCALPISPELKKFVIEMVQHPECLTHSETSKILELVDNEEVKGYVCRLKDLYFEVEESEYQNIISSITNTDGYSFELVGIVGFALTNFRASKLNELVQNKLLFDIRKNLIVEKLKRERLELLAKQKLGQSNSENEMIMAQILEVDRKLFEIKTQKPSSNKGK